MEVPIIYLNYKYRHRHLTGGKVRKLHLKEESPLVRPYVCDSQSPDNPNANDMSAKSQEVIDASAGNP